MPNSHRGRRTHLTDIATILVAIVWGSSYLAAKEVVTAETVVALLLLRFVISIPALGAIALRRIRDLSRKQVGNGVVLGLILAGEFLLETYGVAHTSATNAGLIVSCTMVFTPLAESALTRTRPRATFLMAAAMTVVGAGMLTQGAGLTVPSLGDLLMLLAAVTRTVFLIAVHRLPAIRRTDDVSLTLVQFCTIAVVMAAVAPYAGSTVWETTVALTGRQWLVLLYLTGFCTLLAFFVQIWATRRSSPSRVSLLLGTEPLWATVMGVALGGDRLGVPGAAGVALVIAGITIGRWTLRTAEVKRPSAPPVPAPAAPAPPVAPVLIAGSSGSAPRRPPHTAMTPLGEAAPPAYFTGNSGHPPDYAWLPAQPAGPGAVSAAADTTAPSWTWYVTVFADRNYFEAMKAASGIYGQDLVFPDNYPERHYPLTSPRVRVGRRHRFDETPPEIDLSGPPRDPGVSRDHAALVLTNDDGWAVVDQGSSNGVAINGAAWPITPYVPVPLAEGARIHIGVWTTIILCRTLVATVPDWAAAPT